jgi:hypothetical protein
LEHSMRAQKFPLVLALSIAILSTIGLAGCSSSSTSNHDGGTGGSSATGGSSGGGTGGSGTGGNTGSGGQADAGSDVRTGAGGSAGQDSGAGAMCAALLACCNSATGAQAALKAQCLTAYNMAMPMGDSACGTVLNTIKQNGLCN